MRLRGICKIEEAALAAVCACEAPITADLVIRVERAFRSTADTCSRLHSAYGLVQAPKSACNIKRIERAS